MYSSVFDSSWFLIVPSAPGTEHKLWQHSTKNSLVIQQGNRISTLAKRCMHIHTHTPQYLYNTH